MVRFQTQLMLYHNVEVDVALPSSATTSAAVAVSVPASESERSRIRANGSGGGSSDGVAGPWPTAVSKAGESSCVARNGYDWVCQRVAVDVERFKPSSGRLTRLMTMLVRNLVSNEYLFGAGVAAGLPDALCADADVGKALAACAERVRVWRSLGRARLHGLDVDVLARASNVDKTTREAIADAVEALFGALCVSGRLAEMSRIHHLLTAERLALWIRAILLECGPDDADGGDDDNDGDGSGGGSSPGFSIARLANAGRQAPSLFPYVARPSLAARRARSPSPVKVRPKSAAARKRRARVESSDEESSGSENDDDAGAELTRDELELRRCADTYRLLISADVLRGEEAGGREEAGTLDWLERVSSIAAARAFSPDEELSPLSPLERELACEAADQSDGPLSGGRRVALFRAVMCAPKQPVSTWGSSKVVTGEALSELQNRWIAAQKNVMRDRNRSVGGAKLSKDQALNPVFSHLGDDPSRHVMGLFAGEVCIAWAAAVTKDEAKRMCARQAMALDGAAIVGSYKPLLTGVVQRRALGRRNRVLSEYAYPERRLAACFGLPKVVRFYHRTPNGEAIAYVVGAGGAPRGGQAAETRG